MLLRRLNNFVILLTKKVEHSNITAAQPRDIHLGEVAQWQSNGLISRGLWVQVPPSPLKLNNRAIMPQVKRSR